MLVNYLETKVIASTYATVRLPPEGGVLALEMGKGVLPALPQPDPVAIYLMAQKTPCPSFEINTELTYLFFWCNNSNWLRVLMVFSSSSVLEFLSDLRNQQNHAKAGAIKLEAQKGTLCQ